jgi:hypothetical protein
MLIIEGIRIKNFRVLKDVTLGRTNKQVAPFLECAHEDAIRMQMQKY